MPEIPHTGWTPPKDYPNLAAANVIAVDTETYDPNLLTRGPGWARGDGHIVGVSIGVDTQHKWYFPIRHETETEHNLDPENTLRWLKDTLGNHLQPKIGANITYDVGWLRQEGVRVKGPLVDVQFAEALLDESARVALDVLGQKYLGMGKETNLLYQWLADWFGGEPADKQRKWLYKAPPSLVGPYAESDVDLPLRLGPVLYEKLRAENLLDVFDMECRLIYLMIEMRFAGVSVDVAKAERLRDTLTARAAEVQGRLNELVGWPLDIGKKDQLAKAFDQFGIRYSMTAPSASYPNGQPSFTKSYLEKLNHPIGEHIREIRKCEKLKGTFVESYILDSNVNGKVYGQFHQLRGDEGGTRSGRFSSSTPNLQNLPSRDDELAPMVRGLFIPDDGHKCWRKYDYSQIEYRCLIHDAVGPEGEKVRAEFNADPSIDYHNFIQALIHKQTGIRIERKAIKSINFGLIYGMGVAALSAALGLDKKAGGELVKRYHEGVPFALKTMEYYMALAQETGVIETILGRKSRFDLYEQYGTYGSLALPYEEARRTYSRLQRAYTHKALNRRLQGSAADIMKKAMLQCWEDGVFDETGVPRLTVHDELDFSDPGGKDRAFEEMKRIMETALPLRIPVKADAEIGPDWGHVKE
jgi:DNA polymerase I-like protein with 3'-5' exonuclease and polymerase domains